MKRIIEIIEECSGVKFTPEMLKSQKPEFVKLRNIAAVIASTKMKAIDIGLQLGKSRTIVYHMIKSDKNDFATDKAYSELFLKVFLQLDNELYGDNDNE